MPRLVPCRPALLCLAPARVLLTALCLSLVAHLVATATAAAQGDDADLGTRRRARMERELTLGRARITAGHPSLAIAHFEDARRADPAAPEPYLALGQTLLGLDRRADAIAVLETGRRRAPDDEGLLLTLSEALQANNQARQALALLRLAARRHPTRWGTQARRAEVAQAVGAFTEAADAYAAVLDLAASGRDVPDTERRRAEDMLAALSLLLDGAHPRAGRCAPSRAPGATEAERWQRALAACR